MRSTKTTLGIVGLGSAIALSIVVAFSLSNQLGVAIPDGCLPASLSAVEPKNFTIREPNVATISPDARLRAIDDSLDLVTMYYADFEMCPSDDTPEVSIEKGAVGVTIYNPGAGLKDSSDFQQQELAYFASRSDVLANVQPIEVDGYKGVGWGPYESQNIVRLDGKVIESTPIQGLGAVRYYNDQDGTIYVVEANKPLDKILEIAGSIQ